MTSSRETRARSRAVPARPQAPLTLEGREFELQRLEQGLDRVTVGIVLGFAGMGKTALAATVANAWPGPVLYAGAEKDVSLVALAQAMLQSLAPEAAKALSALDGDDGEGALVALAATLVPVMEEHGALWWLDDLQALSVEEQQWLLHRLAAQLQAGRILVTTRRQPPREGNAPHRVEVRVGPLSEAAASAIWADLDVLYGVVQGFEQAFQIANGVPMALRAIHAGGNEYSMELDPVLALTRGLEGDERTVVHCLAVASEPVGLRTLRRALPGDRVRAALDHLLEHLVVDIDTARRVSLAEGFAGPVLAGVHEDERQAAHRLLAELYGGEPVPDGETILRAAQHLLGAGEPREAGELVASGIDAFVRAGLLHRAYAVLDQVPPKHRSDATERARGVCFSLLGQAESAYSVLRRLAEQVDGSDSTLRLELARSALLTGRVSEADGLLTALAAETADAAMTLRIHCWSAIAQSLQGRFDEARRLLSPLARSAGDIPALGQVLWTRAFSYWLEGEDQQAELAIRESPEAVWRYLQEGAARGLFVSLSAVYANLGQLEEAERFLAGPPSLGASPDTVQSQAVHVERAILLDCQGRRGEAMAQVRQAVETYQEQQMTLHSWWAQIQQGRLMLMVGEVDAGSRLLAQIAQRAGAAGAVAIAAAAEAQAELSLLNHFRGVSATPQTRNRGLRLRERVFAALRGIGSIERGWDQQVPDLSGPLAAEVGDAEGYGVERLVLGLVNALLLRLSDRPADALDQLAAAQEQALQEAVDAAVIDELTASAGQYFSVDGSGCRRILEAVPAPGARAVRLDRTQHTLALDGLTVDIANRPVMRRVVYCLAQNLPVPVDKEALVLHAWQDDYNPAQHDNPLRVNIGRLRKTLAQFGLEVESLADGYRLIVPDDFLFIDRAL